MTLSPAAVREAARLLLDTSVAGRRIDRLPNHLTPGTADEGYAIQHVGHELAGQPLGPWKAGATTEGAQRLLGLDGPFIGRPPANRVVASGTDMVMADWFVGPPMIETEIGLVATVDLADIPDDPMDLAELVDVVACLELVNSRFTDMTVVGAPSLIADNAVASVVVASGPLGWSADEIRRLDRVPVSIDIDGVEAASGTGAMALGHPLHVMHYVAEFAVGSGTPVTSGDLVITGTCTGVVTAASGMRATGRIGGATVEVAFS